MLGEVRTARIFKLLLNVLAPVAHLVRGPFVAMLMFGKENQQRGRIVDKPSKCSIRSFSSVLIIMPQFSGSKTTTIDQENMEAPPCQRCWSSAAPPSCTPRLARAPAEASCSSPLNKNDEFPILRMIR